MPSESTTKVDPAAGTDSGPSGGTGKLLPSESTTKVDPAAGTEPPEVELVGCVSDSACGSACGGTDPVDTSVGDTLPTATPFWTIASSRTGAVAPGTSVPISPSVPT